MEIVFQKSLNKINYILLLPSLYFLLWFNNLFKNRTTGCTVVLIRTNPITRFSILQGKLNKNYLDKKFSYYNSFTYWNPSKTLFYSMLFLGLSILIFLMCFVEIMDYRI